MPNLVKKFRVEVGFLWGAKKPSPPPHITRTQIYHLEDRVKHKRNNLTCKRLDSQGDEKMQFLFLLPLAMAF